jgi:hypothetical protein
MEQNWGSRRVSPSFSCEFGTKDSFHVFKENKSWESKSDETVEDVGEEMPWVFIACSAACT